MRVGGTGTTRAFAVYSLARLGVFVGVAAALFLAGLRGPLLVLAALLGSGLVSYVLLAPQRAALAAVLGGRSRRRGTLSQRIAASAAAEDAYVDSHQDDRPDVTGTKRTGEHQGD
jgi:hypothetical protein